MPKYKRPLHKNHYFKIFIILAPNEWENFNYTSSPRTKAYPKDQVQVIQMMNSSDTVWNIANPHINFILDKLKDYKNYDDNIILSMQFNFKRRVI